MKKVLFQFLSLVFVIVIAITSRLPAQTKLDVKNVPQVVVDAFNKEFTGATNVQWISPKNQGKKGMPYVAKFTFNTQKSRARYTETGSKVHTITHLKPNDFPTNIQQAVKTDAKGATIKGGTKIVKTDNNKTFYRVVTFVSGKRQVFGYNEDATPIKDKKQLKQMDEDDANDGENQN